MRAMRHLIKAELVALVLSLSLTAPVAAGPLEDGQAAYYRHDCAAARQLWRPLADQGNASAQHKLGTTYEFGGDFGCGPHDYFEAAKWYRKAADQGNVDAEDELATFFYTGRGAGKDYVEAIKWFRKAADQGFANAQLFLGLMNYNGEGVPQDYIEAVNWYRKAADQGDEQAQFELGAMYDKGQGVPQDYVQAYKWLNLAAARSPPLLEIRREIVVKLRDQVAAKMTPAQIAEGQKLAREWRPK